MNEFVFWTIAIVSTLTMLASLTWLLWLRAKNTLSAASSAATVASKTLSQVKDVDALIERGDVTLPRDVASFGDTATASNLRLERSERIKQRSARTAQKHEKTYDRWSKYYS